MCLSKSKKDGFLWLTHLELTFFNWSLDRRILIGTVQLVSNTWPGLYINKAMYTNGEQKLHNRMHVFLVHLHICGFYLVCAMKTPDYGGGQYMPFIKRGPYGREW